MASVAHLLWEAKQFYGSVPSVAGHAKVGGSNPRRTSYAPLAVVRAEIYLELVLTEILGVGKRPHLGHHLYPHLGQPGADIGRAVGSVLHSSSSGSSPTDCRCLPMRSVTASASYSLAGRTSTRVISSLSGSSATWNCIPPRCGAGFYGQHASADRPRSRPDPWAPTDAAEGQGPPLALATSLLRYFAARSWADVPAASVRGRRRTLLYVIADDLLQQRRRPAHRGRRTCAIHQRKCGCAILDNLFQVGGANLRVAPVYVRFLGSLGAQVPPEPLGEPPFARHRVPQRLQKLADAAPDKAVGVPGSRGTQHVATV